MASKIEFFIAVRTLRDTLHDRLDDNVSDRVFTSLRLRHAEAVIQARREVEDPSLPENEVRYDPVMASLASATASVKAAVETDEPAMLAACKEARAALLEVEALP